MSVEAIPRTFSSSAPHPGRAVDVAPALLDHLDTPEFEAAPNPVRTAMNYLDSGDWTALDEHIKTTSPADLQVAVETIRKTQNPKQIKQAAEDQRILAQYDVFRTIMGHEMSRFSNQPIDPAMMLEATLSSLRTGREHMVTYLQLRGPELVADKEDYDAPLPPEETVDATPFTLHDIDNAIEQFEQELADHEQLLANENSPRLDSHPPEDDPKLFLARDLSKY